MKRLGLTATVFVVLASQAVALSCLPPNIARTFNQANEAPDVYVMGLGILTVTGPIPKYKEGKPRHVTAQFKGAFLGASGQSAEQDLDVTVDAICYASWCGGFPQSDEKMIAFLKKTETGYRLETNPCGGHFKIAPTPKEIRLLRKCLTQGGCSETQVKSLDIRP